MSGLILVSTIVAAMGIGILCGFIVLNAFFVVLSRNRQQTAAPLAKTAPAVGA